jgi:hypothetical protein
VWGGPFFAATRWGLSTSWTLRALPGAAGHALIRMLQAE